MMKEKQGKTNWGICRCVDGSISKLFVILEFFELKARPNLGHATPALASL